MLLIAGTQPTRPLAVYQAIKAAAPLLKTQIRE